MEQKPHAMWARIIEIIAGVIVLILALYLFYNPNAAVGQVFGIAVIILGLVLLIRAALSTVLLGAAKLVNVIVGIVVLALGVGAIAAQPIAIEPLAVMVVVALLLNAAARLYHHGTITRSTEIEEVRWGNIILGIIAVILAIAAITNPGSQALLVALVALVGIELILSGAVSKTA